MLLTFEHLQLYAFMGSSSLKSLDLEKPGFFLKKTGFFRNAKKKRVLEAVGIYI